jgi:hypothetical protein
MQQPAISRPWCFFIYLLPLLVGAGDAHEYRQAHAPGHRDFFTPVNEQAGARKRPRES